MSEITVRSATKSDCELLLTMVKELAAFHKDPNKVKIDAKVLLEDGFGDNPWYYCLIAEIMEDEVKKPAGFATFHKAYSTWYGKSFVLEDIYVRESYRNRGFGTKILKEVTRHALNDGGNKIICTGIDWNKPVHNFFKKCGAEMEGGWRTFTFAKNAMESFLETS